MGFRHLPSAVWVAEFSTGQVGNFQPALTAVTRSPDFGARNVIALKPARARVGETALR
jgi:hypothetical protein